MQHDGIIDFLIFCGYGGTVLQSETTNYTNFTNLASAYLLISNSTNAKGAFLL